MAFNRRDMLKLAGLGGLGATGLLVPLGSASAKRESSLRKANFPVPYRAQFQRPKVLRPYASGEDDQGRFESYRVVAKANSARILPGLTTPVFAYDGLVPGPTISVEQGTRVKLDMFNALPAQHMPFGHDFNISTHLHGSASLPQFDGYANDQTYPAFCKEYEYPNFQPARTLWYHDHGAHATSANVYAGLAAQYHLHDPFERAQLPQGEFDVPLTLSDAAFAADGRLAYNDNSHSGVWGDVVMVNGTPWPTMKVKRAVYRFRILNGSISRAYKPFLSTGDPLTIVATDGGLMPVAQQVSSYRHGNAERYEVLIDFRKYKPGQLVQLRSGELKNNREFEHTDKIMQFQVEGGRADRSYQIPTTLERSMPANPLHIDPMELRPEQSRATRRLRVQRTNGSWAINGRTWNDVMATDFNEVVANPNINDVEIWEIENKSGGWFHPVHIHLVDFQVIGRNTNGGKPFAWEKGPKDVVYVGENETVRLLMQFAVGEGNTGGKYMVHCHNLPHEDHDMMQQFRVGPAPAGSDPNDPIKAVPCHKEAPPPEPQVYDG